jgi:glycosyltransferase involved in cell wall biosynthesis
MRWTGPPVGIVRVERRLALWACVHLPNVRFAFFDPLQLAYCELKIDASPFLTGDAALSTVGLTNPAKPGLRKTDRAPAVLRSLVLWIGQTRRMLLDRLEALRLGAARGWLKRTACRLQEPLMSKKYRDIMVGSDGTRRPFWPYQMALGARIELLPSDTVICAGSGWSHTNIRAIRDLKLRVNFRLVLLCHDLIPLLFPQFYSKNDVDLFRAYMHEALAGADLVAVTSRKAEEDCRAYLVRHGIEAPRIAVTPLGFDLKAHRDLPVSSLPWGLTSGRFVLMVSTIEPRKGHQLLYNIWRRLVIDGVAKKHGFKLVFIGRPGWMIEDFLLQVRTDRVVSDQILIKSGVDDDLLDVLYDQAAFCVYPSKYEGYGLPICEAFSHGKAILASTGGALPELVQGLAPCLDPDNAEVWYRQVREWIENPDARALVEEGIRGKFSHPTWSEAATIFFDRVSGAGAN